MDDCEINNFKIELFECKERLDDTLKALSEKGIGCSKKKLNFCSYKNVKWLWTKAVSDVQPDLACETEGIKLEFMCAEKDLSTVLSTIDTPLINVIPLFEYNLG